MLHHLLLLSKWLRVLAVFVVLAVNSGSLVATDSQQDEAVCNALDNSSGCTGSQHVGKSSDTQNQARKQVRVKRPCGCQFQKPGLEIMMKCWRDLASTAAPDAHILTVGHPENNQGSKLLAKERVLAILPLSGAAASFGRYTTALTIRHLLNFGHAAELHTDVRQTFMQMEEEDPGRRDRLLQVDILLEAVRKHSKSSKDKFGWLLWMDPDAAVLSDEDVLRRAISSNLIGKKTHIIVCSNRRKKSTPDSGILLLKNAAWTEGFLIAWHRELLALPEDTSHVGFDAALSKAVKRARDLGGLEAAVELPSATLSADMRDYAYASVHEEPIVHLAGLADEIVRHFFHSAWTWACHRPGGLGGVAPARLQEFHLGALTKILSIVVDGDEGDRRSGRTSSQLHRNGRILEKEEYGEGVLDALAGYAPVLLKRALHSADDGARAKSTAQSALRLCLDGYTWVFGSSEALKNAKAARCKEYLEKLAQ